MSFPCHERQQRGPYVTKACTNCQQKHAKCTGGAVCKRCTQRNLVCTFSDSGKKRGPKKNGQHPEQVYVLNGLENDFDGTTMLSPVVPNLLQGHTSTLSSPSEYLQQPDNIDELTFYSNFYEKQDIQAFQEAGSFPYQVHTDTGYGMNLIDKVYVNNNVFFLQNRFVL
ncbi:Cutinase transcription factor 1 alpha [Gigaspora margarita]|uniref:Cutinase transcription factor 1 alpha n=1 Tax=Gigaspora margarita TaxID=4874 RepID=A0A8H4AMA8_GIGMA|nr:Cutinase transcription factor 1 alpha [Gigaspora margarita]